MANFCPTSENICVSRGDSPVIRFRVTDEDGVLEDITGWSFIFTVNTSPDPADDADQVFQISIPSIGDGTSGIVDIQPSTAQTDETPDVYFYDLQATTPTPSVRTLKAGEFEIRQDITKV